MSDMSEYFMHEFLLLQSNDEDATSQSSPAQGESDIWLDSASLLPNMPLSEDAMGEVVDSIPNVFSLISNELPEPDIEDVEPLFSGIDLASKPTTFVVVSSAATGVQRIKAESVLRQVPTDLPPKKRKREDYDERRRRRARAPSEITDRAIPPSYLHVFQAGTTEVPPRMRRRTMQDRRDRRQVGDVSPCLRCRMDRKKCNGDLSRPCERCQSSTETGILWRRPCNCIRVNIYSVLGHDSGFLEDVQLWISFHVTTPRGEVADSMIRPMEPWKRPDNITMNNWLMKQIIEPKSDIVVMSSGRLQQLEEGKALKRLFDVRHPAPQVKLSAGALLQYINRNLQLFTHGRISHAGQPFIRSCVRTFLDLSFLGNSSAGALSASAMQRKAPQNALLLIRKYLNCFDDLLRANGAVYSKSEQELTLEVFKDRLNLLTADQRRGFPSFCDRAVDRTSEYKAIIEIECMH